MWVAERQNHPHNKALGSIITGTIMTDSDVRSTRGQVVRDDRGGLSTEAILTGTNSTDLEVLVVGPFQRGGVHSYIEEQLDRLDGEVTLSSHDTSAPGIGTGLSHVLGGVVFGLLAMVRFCFRSPPDIVHVHSSHYYSFYRASVYVFLAKYAWGVPVVLHIHGSSFDEFVATDSRAVAALQRSVFAACDEILVLSAYWRDILLRRADEAKIRMVPNAVDPARFPVGEGNATPHIVFISTLIDRKGVPELVTAVERLADRREGQFRVSIAGDGPMSDRVEHLADRHDCVEYLGYVSEERKRTLLGEGSIFVLPTRAEGLPIALLEGMAGANAVVSTTVGSIPEVVDRNRGILTEPGDADGLVDALEELITADERRESMAESNRRAVEDRYSWERVTDELVSVYGTLVE